MLLNSNFQLQWLMKKHSKKDISGQFIINPLNVSDILGPGFPYFSPPPFGVTTRVYSAENFLFLGPLVIFRIRSRSSKTLRNAPHFGSENTMFKSLATQKSRSPQICTWKASKGGHFYWKTWDGGPLIINPINTPLVCIHWVYTFLKCPLQGVKQQWYPSGLG